jgi:hypothetical protein
MTIQEAITSVDSLKPNVYEERSKVKWLNNLDLSVKIEVLDTHEGSEAYAEFSGYTEDTPKTTELIVPAPYDELYILYLEAMIDAYNNEYDRYNESMMRFQAKYADFADYYNRTHTPKGVTTINYFGGKR